MQESVTLNTSDGNTLEAELFVPEDPLAAVVIAHPHPQMGGDMYTPVVSAMWRTISASPIAGLRFNFRGVGSSTGSFDHGVGEQLDVAAAMNHLADAVPNVPLVASGWSFGADLALRSDDQRIAGWFLAAAPLKVLPIDEMPAGSSVAPKRFAVPEHDHVSPPARTTESVAHWVNAEVTQIDDTDHFFSGAMDSLMHAFNAFLNEITNDEP